MSTSDVVRLEAFTACYPEPNDNNNLRYLTFARVESSDGAVGWGEAITQFPAAAAATEALIAEWGPLVVGRDPVETHAVWTSIKQEAWWYGFRGGIASFALSAIDIALWDLKGKLLGQSLSGLLGGAVQTRLPVVASTHAFHPSLQTEVERHAAYVHVDGYKGVKIGMGKRGDAHLGYDIRRDVDFVRSLRAELGPDAMLMMDRGQHLRWTLAEAVARTRAFEEHGLTWIEEPLEPADVEGLKKLRAQVSTLVAAGEREWNAEGYENFLRNGSVDVVGCDVGRAEGITGALQVIALVERLGLWFNSHAWSSAINTAASIALSASTTRCLLQEMKPDANPMQNEIVASPFVHRDGYIDVPTGPGLGVEVDEAELRKYAWRR